MCKNRFDWDTHNGNTGTLKTVLLGQQNGEHWDTFGLQTVNSV
jgi:hypothetical protein